jgi:hypothetical protein
MEENVGKEKHHSRGNPWAKAWRVGRDRTWQLIALGISFAVSGWAFFIPIGVIGELPSPAGE